MSQGFGSESVDALKSSRTVRKPTEVASIGCIQHSLVKHFCDIKDPRVERTRETSTLRQFLPLVIFTNPDYGQDFHCRCHGRPSASSLEQN